jgi:hypothetical protein
VTAVIPLSLIVKTVENPVWIQSGKKCYPGATRDQPFVAIIFSHTTTHERALIFLPLFGEPGLRGASTKL